LSKQGELRVAVAGLGFGKIWASAYDELPDVQHVGICDPDPDVLNSVGDELGIERRHTDLQAVLASDDYDAVHLVTPIPMHVEQSIAVMESGKHCACAIPMALSLEDVDRVVDAQRRTGKTYMLMETEIASPAFLYVEQMHREGAFGDLQLLRGVHYQNMEGWPDYWRGLPPMFYCYHGLGPMLHLAQRPVTAVHCRGSGTLPKEQQQYGSRFTVESALFELADCDVICEMTASFHELARGFLSDRFYVYGNRMSFESTQVAGEDPVVFEAESGRLPAGQRSRKVGTRRQALPPLAELVAPEIADVARKAPHARGIPLAHEFIRSLVEERAPAIDVLTAANWTAAGVAAHASAMREGERVGVKQWKGQ
jgi:predicted dehydrogenase